MISYREVTRFARGVNRGFTLLELLVVLVIIGATIALVTPRAFKVYYQTRAYLVRLDDAGFKKKAVFQAFLLDSDCEEKYDNGKAILSCGGQTVLTRDAARKFHNIYITNKGFTPNSK